MNDLQQLHDKTNKAFARRLSHALPAMRGQSGYISQAIQSDAGGPPLRPDPAQGCADEGSDIAGNKEGEFSGHRQHTGGHVAIKNIAVFLVCEAACCEGES